MEDLLLLAYPDRLAKRRDGNDPHAAVMVGKVGVRLAPEALAPAIARSDLFLALDPHHDPRNKKAEATVRTAIPIEESSLARLFRHQLHTHTDLEYDEQKEKVVALTRNYFHDLILHEDPHGKVDPTRAAETLAAALLPRARELLEKSDHTRRLLARIATLRHALPERANDFPAFTEDQLAEILKTAALGKRSLPELLEGHTLENALRTLLPYPLDRDLDQLVPETFTVPTGNNIKIDYQLPSTPTSPPPTPILPVRLQELFGLLETPRICNNRQPLLLHLLSPGYKPIQITQDLKSFWSNAYFEVRKDLRTRYPKHKWPENPLTATPESKGRPHKS